MTPETQNAVEALGRYVAEAGRVKVTDKTVRGVVTDALGMQRLRQPRFDKVIELALSNGGQFRREGDYLIHEDPERLSTPTVLVRKHPDNIKKAQTPFAAPSASPHPRAGRPKHYMGALLEGRLNDQSRELPEAARAAAIFTHCPHCQATLLLSGTITVDSSEP